LPNLGWITFFIWTYSNTHGHVDSISATVPDAPVADFYGTPTSGYAPLTVQFTDTSTGPPTSWSWNFGDGDSTNATMQNPVHTYASAGTYTVSLTAMNGVASTIARYPRGESRQSVKKNLYPCDPPDPDSPYQTTSPT
jgi:uncharacterized membrane protein